MTELDRLTPADVRILELERGNIRGHTCKVVILGERLPVGAADRLRAHVDARLAEFPRLRRRLLPTPLGLAAPAWVDDPDFTVANHVVPSPLSRELDAEGLRQTVARLMATRLERSRPLWHADVLERLSDGRSALVVRIHHALADGMTAGRILDRVVLDGNPPAADAPLPAPSPSLPEQLALALRERASGAVGGLRSGARALGSPNGWRSAGRTLVQLPGVLRRDLGGGADDSRLDAPIGAGRVVGFVACELGAIHRAAKALGEGVTINDLVLTAIGGGLRRWLEAEGAPVADLRAKVPVSLHHAGESEAAAANRDSFMVVDLALDHPDPVERVRAVSAATAERKRHHDAEEIDRLLSDLGHVSRSLERLAERWSLRPRVFAVNVSNVPGPRRELSVLGARVEQIHSLAEVANRHALRASVFSAGGKLSFGLCADAGVIPDIAELEAGVERDLDALLACA